MILFPNAKLNLGLRVLGKRADGFHELETGFVPIGLCDVLEFVESDELRFVNTGLHVDGAMQNNLVVRAYRLLADDFELPPIHIHLHKQIPFGAGLGGGSSDAAFMLKGLNQHFELKLTDDKLKSYAASLGSDCAFFINNEAALGRGRGEILDPLSVVDITGLHLLLVKPEIAIRTADAFANIQPQMRSSQLSEQLQKPIKTWKKNVQNDFETSIFPKYPLLADIKQQLYDLGALYAAMSGSGATVFGLFTKPISIPKAFSDYFVWQEAFS